MTSGPAMLLPTFGTLADDCDSLDELAVVVIEQRAASYKAETELLAAAARWAGLCEPAALMPQLVGDQGLQLGGEGVPPCSEYAPDEFGALMGISTDSAKTYIADALELQVRLPKTWARVRDGQVAPWRGRLIARATIALSFVGASYVDEQVSWCAERVTPAQLGRLVAAAAALAEQEDPTHADDPRHFELDIRGHHSDGTVEVHGCLDLADAIDLDNAISRRASALLDFGAKDDRDVRRAWAVGDLARADLALDLVATESANGEPLAEPKVTAAQPATELRIHVMGSELEAHMAGDTEDSAIARIENTNGFMSLESVQAWLRRSRGQVKVAPVIDTQANLSVNRYEVPVRLRRQIEERDPNCVFPHCSRPARRSDIDHIEPYDSGGRTESMNLAPLCRHHHRAKTHGGWTYSSPEPATYLWRSPGGHHWLRDRSGTRRT